MVADKLKKIADVLYTVHSDLLSVGIAGKDCERFAAVLTRIAQIQQSLRELAEEEGEDVGDS